MKYVSVKQVNAFTREPLSGNPAGVVLDASGLTDRDMQRIARELNNPETAFIFPADCAECDGIIRYFTPSVEVPICGHATIAAMYAWAQEEQWEYEVRRMRTGAGVLPFEARKEADGYRVTMTQGTISLEDPFDSTLQDRLFKALGLDDDDWDTRCPVQVASTGHSKVMIGIRSQERLHALRPDAQALIEISRISGCNGFYVFTFDGSDPRWLVHGRMFAPAIGIIEDPVTGNANGPLGAYLAAHDLARHNGNILKFSARQGEAMGRPGEVHVEVAIDDDRPIQVKISGQAVQVFETQLLYRL